MFLEIDQLTMRFGGLVAVDNVSMSIRQGEIHGLIGPNGSGKTTIFNVLSGYYKPTSGTITFEGKRISGLPAHRITAAVDTSPARDVLALLTGSDEAPAALGRSVPASLAIAACVVLTVVLGVLGRVPTT